MPNVGFAVLQIIPSMRGVDQELRRQLSQPAAAAGDAAGQSAGGSFSEKLKLGVAAGAVAAGAVLVKGLSDAMGQLNAKSLLQAQLGTSNTVAAAQGKVAGKLYASGVTGSFQDAADAIKAVVQGGLAPPGTTTKQLQAIATKASDVAKVFGQDLGGVTNAVSQMIRTGLAKNSSEAFDLITRGLQSGADKGGDFLDTLNEYGTQFRKAGLDGSTAIGLLNQAIRGGARDADVAADAIKEFSIRAVDGSKGTADGFKALGLNADDMAKRFGKGGATANATLDLTLDRLRGIKDPVKQSQVAVALFGTQAEDLGKALLAMDPSVAAKGLGDVGGAASKVGETIRSGPSHEIEVFVRGLKQGFVDVLGGTVLPVIRDVAHWLNDNLGPGVRAAGEAVSGIINWFREWGVVLAPLGLLVGGLTLALNAQAIATGLVTGVMSVYSFASKGIAVVTQGWAAAQALLNAVMALNPIALVAIAVVALGAALVVAWQKSETFRNIVMSAWQGIQTAASWAWNNVLKPVFSAFGTALSAIGTAASWLWNTVISPVFGWIGQAASWLWNNALKPAFGEAKKTFDTLGGAANWLWTNVLKPVFGWIGDKAKWLWEKALKPAFGFIKDGIKKVGDSFEDAKSFIKRAWDKVMDIAKKPVRFIIETVYNKGIVPTWNKVATAFGADPIKTMSLPKGFASGGVLPGYTPGRDVHRFYSTTGGGLELSGGEAIMRPEWTRAVGPGFVALMNRVAKSRGAKGVREALAPTLGGNPTTQRFADGGIFGWIGKTAAGVGSKAWEGAKKLASWLKEGLEASARAGVKHVVDPMLSLFPGADTAFGKMIRRIPTKILDAIFGYSKEADKRGAGGGVGGPRVQAALKWARAQNGKPYIWGSAGPAGFDCSGFMGAIENILRGIKPNSRRWSTFAFQGGTAPAGWAQNATSPFRIGITNAGVGHTAGTLGGVNVESRGGDGVVVGKRARGYSSSLFTHRYGFVPAKKFDSGGWLQPGVTAAVNATGHPEAILTARQWQVARAGLAQAGGGLQAGDSLRLVVGEREFDAYVDGRAQGRVDTTLRAAVVKIRGYRGYNH
ncbi:phage tail tape measure protein [Streptomyces sp. NPDC049887]|uniref:phage tail tape measure protein n=1 Tax=Streptomyces sp. NPDC049887 TaxID=3155654 RepID=UPI00342F2B0F